MYINLKSLIKSSNILFNSVLKVRNAAWFVLRSQVIEEYLKAHSIRKLQIGAGPHWLEGWLNTDIYSAWGKVVYLDATQRFPFEDCTFDYIFSEHQIEHLDYEKGAFMLKECHRVLKPGGKIRIATPDLLTLINLFQSHKTEQQEQFIKYITDNFFPDTKTYNPCFVINNNFRNWGHQFIYDFETLKWVLEKNGFTEVNRQILGESNDENFINLESHGKGFEVYQQIVNQFETMVVEAQKH